MRIKKSCGELRELDIVGFVNELRLKLLLLPCDDCAKSNQLEKLREISLQHFGTLQHFGKCLYKLGINL
jgi:hypothetical protein